MDLRKFLLFLLLPISAFAADKPSAEILNRWVGGQWPLTGEILDSPFGKAAKITGVSRCAWSPDHIFVICDQELHVGEKSERELSIYAFDDKTGKFHFYSLTPASDHASNGSLEISDDGMRWIYSGTIKSTERACSSERRMNITEPIRWTGGQRHPQTTERRGSKPPSAKKYAKNNRAQGEGTYIFAGAPHLVF